MRGIPAALTKAFLLVLLVLAFLLPGAVAQTFVPSDWALLPPGLRPGDSFRLLFVSSESHGVTSGDIDVYNRFVQGRAAAGHAAIRPYASQFRVVASTANVHARNNTSTHPNRSVPIYWLNGSKVADDYRDFYDGSWDDEANSRHASGGAGPRTWLFGTGPITGSNHNGTGRSNRQLGAQFVARGSLNSTQSGHGPLFSNSNARRSATGRFYALSPVFIVQGDVVVADNWDLNPVDLVPGDSFRLLFLSATTRDATASAVADYNTFIRDRAAAGHSAIASFSSLFTAVGCTSDTDARDNTATTTSSSYMGVPIYWLNGSKVADDYEDFYDGSWDEEADDKNESGGNGPDTSQTANYPFTGCDADGTEAFMSGVNRALGSSLVRVGRPGSADAAHGPIGSDQDASSSDARPLYGLSPVLSIALDPASVHFAILTAGSGGLAGQIRGFSMTDTTDFGALSARSFDYYGSSYRIDVLTTSMAGTLFLGTDTELPRRAVNDLTLVVDGTEFRLSDSVASAGGRAWTSSDLRWSAGASVPVKVTFEDGPPTLTAGHAVNQAGTTVTLHFDEDLAAAASQLPRNSNFLVLADMTRVSVTGVAVGSGNSSNEVTLTLGATVRQGQTVTVAYEDHTDGDDSRALQDGEGNDVVSFSDVAVTNNSTYTPPALATGHFVSTDGLSLDLYFAEDLAASSANAPTSSFTVTAGGGTVPVQSVTAHVGGDQKRLRLGLARAIREGQTVTVSYTDPTAGDDANALQDRDGDDVASFADLAVTNNSTVTATVPGPPASLSAAPATGPFGRTQIDLVWRPPSDTGGSAIGRYKIEVSDDGGMMWADLHTTTFALTGYNDTGLSPGTTRHYRVSAINSVGTGLPSATASATTRTAPPGAPTGLTATAIGATRIDLSWMAPSNIGGAAISGYRIEVSSNAGTDWADLETDTGGTATTYSHTGLAAETTRHYRVSAINSVGAGSPSGVANATTGTAELPDAPTTLVATANGETQIDLTWHPPDDNGGTAITGYRIEVSTNAGVNWADLETDTDSTATAYSDSGLSNGDTRHYRVSAINSVGAGPHSNVANATTATPSTPSAPTALTANAVGATQIDLSWMAPSDTGGAAISGYRIEVSTNAGTDWADLETDTRGTATTYSHTDLAGGTTRHYRVSAINSAGSGSPSNVANATTGPTRPDAPTGLTAEADGETQIDLSWDAPNETGGSAITGYRIEVSSNAGADWSDLETNTGSTATEYSDTGLAGGTTRHYRVSAINSVGTGPPSNDASATTATGTPGAPGNLTAIANGRTQIDLSWDAPDETGGSAITGYRIEVSSNAGADWSDLETNTGSAATQYSDTGLAASTTRHYRVSAINSAGTGSRSGVARARTDGIAVPDIPTGLTAVANGDTQIDLSWNEPSDDGGATITGYRIEVSSDYGTNWSDLETDTDSSATTYSHTGLTVSATRHYRLSAINSVGTGSPSRVSSATTGETSVLVPSNWALLPPGLRPGDSFRLLFVSSESHGVTSGDIDVYNRFVQGRAAAGHAAIRPYASQFRVVASTANVHARNNTSTHPNRSVPIYWLNGSKVADDYRDFYDGSWDDEANSRHASGGAGPRTWLFGTGPITGSNHNGTGRSNRQLGAQFVARGSLNSTQSGHGPLFSNSNARRSATGRFYALSPVFIVQGDVVVADNWDLNPVDLVPGDSFRLLFLSATTRDATASAVADYNTFIRDRAAAGHSAIASFSSLFTAVGCTSDTDARDNTATTTSSSYMGVPIYWLNGSKVADDYEDFYDGSWDEEADDKNESGGNGPDTSQTANYPFTGCDADGTEAFMSGVNRALGSSLVRVGRPGSADAAHGPIGSDQDASSSDARPLYGLSPVLSIALDPASVHFAILTAGSGGLAGQIRGFSMTDTTDFGALSARSFDYYGSSYRIDVLTTSMAGTLFLGTDTELPRRAVNDLTLVVDGTEFRLSDSVASAGGRAWTSSDLRWSAGASVPVKVTFEDGPPTLTAGHAVNQAGTTVTLHFDEDLAAAASQLPRNSNFLVLADMTRVSVTGVAVGSGNSSNEVTLTLGATVRQGQTVTVAYEDHTDGDDSRALQDGEGNDVVSFSDVAVTNNSTYTPPALATGHFVSTDGLSLDLYFAEDLAASSANAPTSSFTVTAGGGTVPVQSVTAHVGGDQKRLRLGLARAIREGQTVTVSYTDPTAGDDANALQDRDGDDVASFADLAVTNNSTVTATVPGPPASLSAAPATGPIGRTQIDLVWRPPSDTGGSAIRRYKIEVSDDGGMMWADLHTTTFALTGYNDTGLSPGTTRHYRVSAINSVGTGLPSETASATTAPAPPGAPTDLTATAIGATRIDLSWMAPSDLGGAAISGYRIEVSSNAGTDWADLVGDTESTATNHSETDLSPGTTRHYRISAINSAGTGSASDEAYATTYTPVTVSSSWPLIPSELRGGESFRLLFLSSAARDATSTAIADYNTFVQNRAAAGHSDIQSHSSRFKAVGCTADTDARDNTETNYASSEKGPPIYWLDGDKAADNYEDFYDGSWLEEANDTNESGTDGPDTSQAANYPFTGCTASGTEYVLSGTSHALGATHVAVGRPNVSGQGPLSSDTNIDSSNARPLYGLSPVFVVAATVPEAPTGLTAMASGQTVINLSWSAPSHDGGAVISGYRIEVSSNAATDWSDLVADTESTATVYSDTTLSPGTTRYYRVSAINSVGTGPASAAANAMTLVPAVTVSFGSATYTATEGGTAATVMVQLDKAPGEQVAIPITATAQGGAASGDYSGVPATVTFGASDTSKTFTVTATDDSDDDDGESLQLGFGTLPTGVSAGSPATATVSLADDDGVRVSFGAASYTATEGGAAATVTVQLDVAPEAEVVIPITVTAQGGATSGDYSGVPATVTFGTSDTSKTFTVTAADDSDNDDGESLQLGFGTLPTGVKAGSPATATVSLADNDGLSVRVSFGSATYTATEGGTAATVTVQLDKAPGEQVEIPITATAQGGAASGDYSGVPATVTFGASDTSKTFTVTATDDSDDDDGESLQLGFGTLPTGVSAGTLATAAVSLADDDGVRVSFGAASYTATEGGTAATVTVQLDKAPEAEVVIPITVTARGGAASGDYSGVPVTVTFGTSDTSKTFTVTAADDSDDDDGESLQLGFGTLPTGVKAGSPATATVSLADDDVPAVTVAFGAASYTATEGGAGATVTVQLSAAPEREVEIPIMATAQGGAASGDYSGVPATVTFGASDTSKTFTVTAADDSDDDDGESLQLAFGTLPTGVSAGTPATAAVSLADDDGVRVSFGAASYTATEGGTAATVTVQLDKAPEAEVAIPITATARGGAASGDYSGVPATVTFGASDTSKTFTVTATDDSDDDDGESLQLGFGTLPTGVKAGSPATATVSLADDDVPAVTVAFGAASYTATEGGAAATVTVQLSAAPEREVEIPITATAQGGAASGDYSGVPATVTFGASDTSKTFTVTATDDSDDDDGESLQLGFGTLPTGVSAGTPATAAVSLADDDGVRVSFGAASYTATEGGAAATVTVQLDVAPEAEVVIPITVTAQGGAASGDYSGVPATVTFGTSDTSKTFTVTAADDSDDDDGESLQLGFGTLPTGVKAGSPATATVSLADDDVPAVTVAFGAASYTATEGGAGATVTVQLSAAPEREVEIPITATAQGGAASGDYSGVPATVTFGASDTSKTFTVTAADDSDDDDGESLQLGFGTLPTGVSAGTPATAAVSLADDDGVRVSFGAASYTATEGGTAATVTVQLDKAPEAAVVIPITATARGGAASGDYSGVPATVTFGTSDTSKTFTVTAADDSDNDDGESLQLGFGTLPTGVKAGSPATATVSLADNDGLSVRVSFGSATYTATEGGTAATVTVQLDKAPGEQVEIPITATAQGGAASGDYSGVPATVTFGASDTSKTFTVTATDDSDDDDGESLQLGFGTLPTGVSAGTPATAAVSLADDDGVRVSFGAASYTATEGGAAATVTVQLDVAPEAEVVIPITVTAQGGAASGDYSGVPATVTFGTSDTSKTFTVTAADDSDDDDGESLQLGFGTLPTGVKAGSPATATVSLADDDVPAVTVAFGAASYTATEGGAAATVTVQLSAAPEREVEIPITATAQGGAASGDYSGVPATVTFGASDTSKTFTVTATDDSDDDDGESLQLGFGTLPTGVSAGTPATAAMGLADDDGVRVSFGAASYTATEGGTAATVTVQLDKAPEAEVVIPITVTAQGGAASGDYSGVPATVTFGTSDTSKTFTVTAADDSDDDDGESLQLGFGTLPTGVKAGSPATATVSLADDDVPAVTVAFGAASYTATEGGAAATVTVQLSAAPEREVEIPITATAQGGAASGDYSGVPATVTFGASDTSKTFTVTAADDSDDDDGESLQLAFGTLPTGVSAGTPATAAVSLADDDGVRVSFGAASYTATEGGTAATVTVQLDKAPEAEVAIPITATARGGATSGDYSGVPATVTFGTSDTSKTFTVTAADDSDDDDGESLQLGFGTLPTGVKAGSPATATVSLADDDVPAVTVAFGAASYTATEGGAAATVTVQLSAAPEREVEIPITVTAQGGAASGDYSGVPATVTFGASDTSKTFTVTAADDSDDDDGESLQLGFGTLPTGVSAGSPATAAVSLADDDGVRVSFGAASYTATEGGTAATVTVQLDVAPEAEVVIPITVTAQGGAASGDYSGVPATVTFGTSDTSKTFTVTAADDSDDDDGESLQLGFGTLPTGVKAGSPATATVSLADDDVPAVTVAFGAASYTATEGGAAATVTVQLSAAPEREVEIPITATAQGGAASGDYSGVPATVTFGASDTSKTFTVTAADDSDDDDGESLQLGFGTLPTGVSAGSPATAAVSLADDDGVRVSFGAASYTATEGGTAATVTVQLDVAPEAEVVIPITATAQGGATSGDYSGVPATVTFGASDTSKTFTVTATDDSDDDDGESLQLGFGTLPTGVSAGSPATATVSLADDDGVRVSFGAASYTATEGGAAATVTVQLDVAPEAEVEIPITATAQGGAASGDYSGVPATVTFGTSDTSKTFTVTAADDSDDDDGESLQLGFGTLPTGVSAGSPATATVSLADDDVPAVTVAFGAASYTATEGGAAATVTVQLSAAPEREVEIPITVTAQGGAASADYSGVPATVTFGASDTSKTFTVTATDDSDDDDGESLQLGFGTLPTGVSAGTPATAAVSLADDDGVRVSFGAASYTATEGGTAATVTVQLDKAPEAEVVIPITVTAQGGAASGDYSGVPATVTFGTSDTSKTFTVTAADDSDDDDGESLQLGFGTLPTGVKAGSPATATVSLADDDVPAVTVAFGAASYTATEGGAGATVTVQLSAAPEREVEIPITATAQGGAASGDYSGVPATVTFGASDTSKTFTVTAADDSDDDDGESLQLGFGTLPTGVSAGSPATAAVSLADDDGVRVSFGAASYTATEGGTAATVTVQLDVAPEAEVVIPITATAQGGATSGDYSGVPATVTFGTSDTSKTFTVTAADDSDNDDGESLQLGFGTLPTGVKAGSPATATVSLADNDGLSVRVSFGSATYTATEGGTAATVTVQLDKAPGEQVEIPITATAQGGAASGDYSGVPATVTFGASDTSKTFTVTATDDSDDDDGESLQLGFGTLPTGVSAGSPATATVSLADDDGVRVSFGAASYTATEGGAAATVTVQLDVAPEAEVEIPITATAQGGAASGDYSGVPATVTFGTSDTSKTFTVTAADDSDDDDGESLQLGFGTLPTGVSAGSPATATVSLADDDVPAVTVAFGAASYTATEGGAAATVTVQLSAAPEREVEIPITVTAQGGAASGDYSGVPATVTFGASDTSKTFTVTATDDSDDDDGESLQLGFGTLPTGVSAGTPATAAVSLADDDGVRVSFGAASYTATEGGTAATVTVQLDKAPEAEVVIPITVTAQGGATSGDYSGVPATVTFGTSDTSKTFTVTAADDSDNDDGESLQLGFGTLPTGVSAGSPATATVSLADDDVPAVTVAFGAASYTATEGGAGATVTVQLSAAPEREVEIPITATAQGGAASGDYSGVPATVTFGASDTSKTFTVTAADDSDNDDGESLQLGFGTLPTDVSAGSPATATVSLADNDGLSVTVSFGAASYTATEGGTAATVTVQLDKALGEQVEIPITVTAQGGATSGDYAGVPATVTFGASDTSKTFTVTAADDSDDDDGESLQLGFGTLPTGVSAGSPATAAVSLADDDYPAVAVAFGAASYAATEGGAAATVTVQLSAAPERQVEIPITATAQGGAASGDYAGVPATVTFGASDTSKTFTVTATDDSDDDDGESLQLGFGMLPTGVSAGSRATATVSLVDNDEAEPLSGPPDVVRDLVASAGGRRVRLTWRGPASDGGSRVSQYAYRYRLRAGTFREWTDVRRPDRQSTDRHVVVEGLSHGRDYVFQVRARNRHGWGPSAEVSVITASDGSGVCDRTGAIQQAILAMLPGTTACEEVTASDLAKITGTLDLSGRGIRELVRYDLANMANVEVLSLADNLLYTLPTGIFRPLVGLRELNLAWNWLPPGSIPYDELEALPRLLRVITLGTESNRPGATIVPTALTLRPGGSGVYTVRLDSDPAQDGDGVRVHVQSDSDEVTVSPELLHFTWSNWWKRQEIRVRATSVEGTAVLSHKIDGYEHWLPSDIRGPLDVTVRVEGSSPSSRGADRPVPGAPWSLAPVAPWLPAEATAAATPDADWTPARLVLWTDRLGYSEGDPLSLYVSRDPMGDNRAYVTVFYRENVETGKREYFAPETGSTALGPVLVDQYGALAEATRARRVDAGTRVRAWSGEAPEPGLWVFVVELRRPDLRQVLKRVHARFVVADRQQVVPTPGSATVEITGEERWNRESVYRLRGPVRVRPGGSLSIEAGTLVQALGEAARIEVDPGGTIFARGRKEAPVVMTCDAPLGEREPGCWGGLVVRGQDAALAEGSLDGEGPTGTLAFVRVEFAGAGSPELAAAVLLDNVASTVAVEALQVHASAGNGIEIIGGSVGCFYCVASGSDGTGLAWGEGWSGIAQHLYVQQGSGGLAAAGDSESAAEVRSQPVLSNATLAGDGWQRAGPESATGLLLRFNTAMTMRNSVIAGFNGMAIEFTAHPLEYLLAGTTILEGLILVGNRQGAGELPPRIRVAEADPLIHNSRREGNADPRPRGGSVAIATGMAVAETDPRAILDGDHVGAFGTRNWLEGWTFFGPEEDYSPR